MRLSGWQRLGVLAALAWVSAIAALGYATRPAGETAPHHPAYHYQLAPASRDLLIPSESNVPAVDVEMPNGHTLRFRTDSSRKDQERVAREYYQLTVKAKQAERSSHNKLYFMLAIIPCLVAGLAFLGTAWVRKGFLDPNRTEPSQPTVSLSHFAEVASPSPPGEAGTAGSLQKATSLQVRRVGGWLLFFCILITIWFPLSAFNAFFAYEEQMRTYGFNDPLVRAMGNLAVGSLALALISTVCGILIWRGSQKGKRIAVWFLVGYPLFALLISAAALHEIEGVPGTGQARADIVMYVVGKVLFSIIWLAYFFMSKRVKNYYP